MQDTNLILERRYLLEKILINEIELGTGLKERPDLKGKKFNKDGKEGEIINAYEIIGPNDAGAIIVSSTLGGSGKINGKKDENQRGYLYIDSPTGGALMGSFDWNTNTNSWSQEPRSIGNVSIKGNVTQSTTSQQGVSNQSQVNTATNTQTQRGLPITNPNDINVNTIFIVAEGNQNMFCKVTEIKDNVMIKNKKYKMVKAVRTDTTTPSQCGISKFNDQPGWIAFDYETNTNSTRGHFLEPNTEYPQGFLSQSAFRDNSNSIFTPQQGSGTQSQTNTSTNTAGNTSTNTTGVMSSNPDDYEKFQKENPQPSPQQNVSQGQNVNKYNVNYKVLTPQKLTGIRTKINSTGKGNTLTPEDLQALYTTISKLPNKK